MGWGFPVGSGVDYHLGRMTSPVRRFLPLGVVALSLGGAALGEESMVSSLVSGTSIAGAVDTSAQWKPGPGSTMATRGMNTAPSHYNGFNLEFLELRLERPLDAAAWSSGYKVEMWYGQDADWLPGALAPNFAVKQAYVSLRVPVGNGLDFKVGQFDAIIGYEYLAPYVNPNVSRSLGNWIEPFSHTGALATYEVSSWITLTGGVANSAYGVMNTKQPWSYLPTYGVGQLPTGPYPKGNGTLTYMGLVTFKAPESWGFLSGGTLAGGIVEGAATGRQGSINYYAGITVPTPIPEVTLGVAYDYNAHAWDDPTFTDTWAQALAGYVSWQIVKDLKLQMRVEYADSSQTTAGVWILPLPGEADGYIPGSAERLFAVTATLEYPLWANVVSRLEGVWDRDLRQNKAFNGNLDAVLLLAEIAYRF